MAGEPGGGVKIESREDFEAWLDKRKPRKEICVALAARAALRALPFAAMDIPEKGEEERARRFARLCAALFRATALARVAAKYPTRANELRAADAVAAARAAAFVAATATADAAAAAAAAARGAARAAAAVAADAVAAARAAAFAAATAAADAVAAARAAAFVAATAARAADDASFWRALAADVSNVESGQSSRDLADAPLWPEAPPTVVADNWRALAAALPDSDGWAVWKHWYVARLNGEPWSEARELVFATVPVEKWDEGPVAANAWIAERLGELGWRGEEELSDGIRFDDLFEAEIRHVEQRLKQDPHGATIKIVEGRARIAPALHEDDASAAQDPQTTQLHERARVRAVAARDRVVRLANQPGFESIADTVDQFERIISGDTLSVAANISTVWELSTAIGTFIERDEEVRAGRGGLTAQMDADAREALDQLLMVAAPFVRRFPTARENDDEVRRFKQTRESIEKPRRVLAAAKTERLIEQGSEKIINIASAAAERGEGVQAEKSRSWLGKTARNMTLAFMVFVAAPGALATKYGEKAIEEFYDHSRSRDIIQKFLLEKESDIIELFRDLPPDVGAAVREVYRRLKVGAPARSDPPRWR